MNRRDLQSHVGRRWRKKRWDERGIERSISAVEQAEARKRRAGSDRVLIPTPGGAPLVQHVGWQEMADVLAWSREKER